MFSYKLLCLHLSTNNYNYRDQHWWICLRRFFYFIFCQLYDWFIWWAWWVLWWIQLYLTLNQQVACVFLFSTINNLSPQLIYWLIKIPAIFVTYFQINLWHVHLPQCISYQNMIDFACEGSCMYGSKLNCGTMAATCNFINLNLVETQRKIKRSCPWNFYLPPQT